MAMVCNVAFCISYFTNRIWFIDRRKRRRSTSLFDRERDRYEPRPRYGEESGLLFTFVQNNDVADSFMQIITAVTHLDD